MIDEYTIPSFGEVIVCLIYTSLSHYINVSYE